MTTFSLDHIAVVARSLSEGCEYVKDCLGIDVPFGGEHPLMGTHNCLAKLGNDEFLEIIAINPRANPPNRPRWFNLDHHGHKAPYLAHWIARTPKLTNVLPLISAPVGVPMDCSRGHLTWQLTVPDDGSFAFDGMFPSLIEWPMRPFPGASMADVGCNLQELSVTHPDARALNSAFDGVLEDERITVNKGDEVSLSATINTPSGVRILR